MNIGDEEQNSYILEFVISKGEKLRPSLEDNWVQNPIFDKWFFNVLTDTQWAYLEIWCEVG